MSRIDINQIKRDAKKFGRHNQLDYQRALDEVAKEYGYVDWMDLRNAHRQQVAEEIENAQPTDPNAHLPKPVVPVILRKRSRKFFPKEQS